MSSVDGRLLPSRWTKPFDGTSPGKLFAEYAEIGRQLNSDAWMFGKATTREMFPYKFMHKSKGHPTAGTVHLGNRSSERLFITIDHDADIFFTSDRLRGDNIVTILGTNATDDYLSMLEDKGISYIVLPDVSDLGKAMEVLAENFGVKKISLQGGGIIDGAMLAAGLLDELSLVIYPGIDGLASNPSIFEYPGPSNVIPAEGLSLELVSCKPRENGVIWLRYKFHNKRQHTGDTWQTLR